MYIEIKKHRKMLEIIMATILLVSVTVFAIKPGIFCSKETHVQNKNEETTVLRKKKNGNCVVIDPGHGGKDPGKVGVQGSLEKEINLEIGKCLKESLEKRGYEVFMTRTDDGHLGPEKFRKTADLNERCRIINDGFRKNSRAVMVSIHQNSFENHSVSGGQCFYYHQSTQGKILAESIQKKLNEKINITKEKKSKSNDNYYILMNSKCPGVIIECGFLSNPEEERKLSSKEYQSILGEVIAQGIEGYYSNNRNH